MLSLSVLPPKHQLALDHDPAEHLVMPMGRAYALPVHPKVELTLDNFLSAYQAELLSRYSWAQNDAQMLTRVMTAARATITNGEKSWHLGGPAVERAWSSFGKRGQPSMQRLRELP